MKKETKKNSFFFRVIFFPSKTTIPEYLAHESLQNLTVLPTEFFRRCKTHIPSVIILPTESKTEMIRR